MGVANYITKSSKLIRKMTKELILKDARLYKDYFAKQFDEM